MKRLALFVDVQNIYYTLLLVWQPLQLFWSCWILVIILLHPMIFMAELIDLWRMLEKILRNIGFDIKLKPYIQRADGSAKGDWDVGITIDMMAATASTAEPIDCAVLLSGDGDFDLLLQHINREHGVDTVVYGVPALTAASLVDAATEFRSIDGSLLLK